MKNAVSVFCLSFLVISPLSAQHAPWEKTAGPPGLEVNVIYKANSVVYAGTKTQGVYKSTDEGLNWTAANSGIELTMIHDLIASGGNLLAAVSGRSSACPGANNVFKSTDNGTTWSLTSGLSGKIVNSFAMKGSFVYAGFSAISGSGLWRSSNNGNTWQEVASPIENGDKIFVSGNAIIVADDNFIWRSLDDGASWDLVEKFALTGISSFARAGTRLFAASGSGMMTSENNGGSWTFSPFAGGVASFSSNGTIIYLGSNSKVFKSTNQGATWIDVSTGLGKGFIQALLYDGSNLFAGTPDDSAGIYRSTNGGTNWTPAAAGLPVGSNLRSLISFGGFVFAGMNGDGIYRSSDRGDTWTKVDISNSLLVQQLVLTFCVKDNALFAGAANGIYKSTDGGATFQRTLNGFPTNTNVTAYSLTVSSGNIIAAVNVSLSSTQSLHAIFYSSDNGSTWHQANLPITPTAVTAVASDGSSLAYAGVFGQSFSVTGLYKSFDAGVTWVSRTTVNSLGIERLAANGNNVLASTLFTAFYSRDFGELEWAPSTPGSCPFGCGIFTYTLRGSSIFAGNSDGMFLSTDSGVSWTSINEGFPACPRPDVEASCADSNYLFAGTFGEGVWRKVIDPLLALSRVVSRKTHGTAGIFDVDMPITGTSGVEDRSGGASGDYTIVISVTNPVTDGSAKVTAGSGSVSAVSFSGNDMIVSLTGVANQQVLTLTASGVTDVNGNVLDPVSIPVGFLKGDTNGNRAVSASDVAQTKAQSGAPVTGMNFRQDVNVSGAINASDIAFVKSASGTSIP
jgi:photosystem II stability/assembly factor-like uncharacterized protein